MGAYESRNADELHPERDRGVLPVRHFVLISDVLLPLSPTAAGSSAVDPKIVDLIRAEEAAGRTYVAFEFFPPRTVSTSPARDLAARASAHARENPPQPAPPHPPLPPPPLTPPRRRLPLRQVLDLSVKQAVDKKFVVSAWAQQQFPLESSTTFGLKAVIG